MNNIITEIITWTPAFAAGFGINLSISITSMIVGTIIGYGLAYGRSSNSSSTALLSSTSTGLFRNIPSFVFMFYIAFITPVEFEWQGNLVRFPLWIKASIALAIPVIGFASDQFYHLIKEGRKKAADKNPIALAMFFISWSQYFVIILMASSTASVIGANEIIGRANTAIAINRDPNMIFWIYLYVALWFLLSASIINFILKKSSNYLVAKKQRS